MKFLLAYLLLVNLLLFALMGIDKYKAAHEKWRIRESTLFVLAIIGGSAGGILGMRVFRHKTLHRSFRLGFPGILVVQILFTLGILIWPYCA
jgi:uncharacterized membrane protein YsdA (DUF1294 family)